MYRSSGEVNEADKVSLMLRERLCEEIDIPSDMVEI